MKKEKEFKIIFVCQYNRRRSQIAEAYFNKVNKNKKLMAKSAGIFIGQNNKPKDLKLAKKFGLTTRIKPQGINADLLRWQNLTVIVAKKVPKNVFWRNKKFRKQVIKWDVEDSWVKTDKDYQKLINQISKKVDNLIKKLEKKLK